MTAQADAEHFSRIGMMAATMAHEIKNPLGGIYGAAQILKEGSGSSEKFLNIILKDATRLNDVIRKFLDFSAPFKTESKPFDVLVFINQFISDQNSLNQGHLIKLECEIKSLSINSDVTGLEQILLNLVQNAMRYHQGESSILIRLIVEKPKLRFWIENRGEGIPNSDKEKIFMPFFTTSTTGTGLGLPTSKKIAKALKGDLYFEEANDYTRFIIDLPLK
ncbi:MAG: HAMP domain-containing histidine kinase [Crocinitomicaceae bacterium]|nr:HAMP domain-containing histidine kinase [Crocinitomicaceae bacterium]